MKIIEFFKKPRNLYLSIVTMLIVVFGLSSITFSYYIEDSSDSDQVMKVKTINTVIQTDDLDSNEITLLPYESKTIVINVISSNDYPNDFKIYYVGDGVAVTSNNSIKPTIDANETITYELTFTNEKEEVNIVKLGIANGYLGATIEIDGNEIK